MQRPPIYAFSDIFGPDLTPRIVALCMGIAICHRRKFGQVWGAAPLPLSRRQSPVPEGTPLDLRLPQRKIWIVLRCNLWKVCFRGSVRKIGQNPKIGQLWRPVSSATVRRKVPGPWSRGVNSICVQCILWRVTCSLLWVRCLFHRFSISDFGANDP